MGVGSPEDLINGIWRGIDFFDCVLPTRLARHGAAMTFNGRLNMMNQKYIHDKSPIAEGCTCYTCQHFNRAYIRHLLNNKEMLAATLLSIHNIHTLEEIVRRARQAIFEHRYDEFARNFLENYH